MNKERKPIGEKGPGGDDLYIDEDGFYCTAEGTPSLYRCDDETYRRVWGSGPNRRFEEALADLVKVWNPSRVQE